MGLLDAIRSVLSDEPATMRLDDAEDWEPDDAPRKHEDASIVVTGTMGISAVGTVVFR